MKKKIVVMGTGNAHKVAEIAPLLNETGLGIDLRAASAYGAFDPDESGATLEENALIKARAALALSGEWALSDDTGLFADALDGRPGIFAARYAGQGCSFDDNIRKMLGEMSGVPEGKRGATFSCVIALCRPGLEPLTFRGECRGRILEAWRGAGGFGYDPIFVIDSVGKSFAELNTDEKNAVSHRAIAVKKCREVLKQLLTA